MLLNIQILRALAALMVVFFHTVGTAYLYGWGDYYFNSTILYKWGAIGVDIFFIISGFIMVYIQAIKKRSPYSFLKDRIIRIVPIYWFLTAFYALLLLVLPSIFNQKKFDIIELFQSLFFMSGVNYSQPILYVGWSLEYEMLFYIFFSISLFFSNIKYTVISTITLTVLSVIFFKLNGVALNFLLGMLVGLFWIKRRNFLSPVVSFFFIVIGFALIINTESPDSFRALIWGVPSLLIFVGFLYYPEIKNKILIRLGDASYSIYLIQVFSIPFFYKMVLLLNVKNIFMNEFVYIFSCVLFSAIVGFLVYFYIEKPLGKITKYFIK